MDIINYELSMDFYIPDVLYEDFKDKNICFLDIETTGLSSKYNNVILIGGLCIKDKEMYITQFFANHVNEEHELLTEFKKFLNSFDYIITYNGASFDIPFLNKRLDHHKIIHNINEILHIDLLKLVRKHKELLGLQNCKLKTVEKSLGIYREDTISGKESLDLYRSYMNTNDNNKKKAILKHNYDDIYYLPQLLYIYDLIKEESVLELYAEFNGKPVILDIDKANLEFKNNNLSINGQSKENVIPSQVFYKDYYSLNWDTSKGELEIELKYEDGYLTSKEKCYYVDLSKYELDYFKCNKLGYTVADNILFLKIDNKIIHDNLLKLLEQIFKNLN